MNFSELCISLRGLGVKSIYLIHEPYREVEVRKFAEMLKKEGFVPLVACDFRSRGENIMNEAIERSDFSLVVAFDDETEKIALEKGVKCFRLKEV
jgi:hypothetical protein